MWATATGDIFCTWTRAGERLMMRTPNTGIGARVTVTDVKFTS